MIEYRYLLRYMKFGPGFLNVSEFQDVIPYTVVFLKYVLLVSRINR